jgi:hypothetical protein
VKVHRRAAVFAASEANYSIQAICAAAQNLTRSSWARP